MPATAFGPAVKAAVAANASKYKVASGSKESVGYVTQESGGAPEVQEPKLVGGEIKKGSTTGKADIPKDARAMVHGHIDGGPRQSNGMVDAPSANGGFGDASGIASNLPVATVSQGMVGWHEMVDGQLQFSFPADAMSPEQRIEMQQNLDDQQALFLIPE